MAQLSKMGAVIGCVTAASALVGMIGGCGSGGGGFGTSQGGADSLVGTWTRATIASDGILVTCPNNLIENTVTIDSCAAGETAQFTSSGTYTKTYPKLKFGHLFAEYGTYTKSGSTLILTRVSTATDTQDNGTLVGITPVPLTTPQVLTETISFSSNSRSFTVTPIVSFSVTVPLSPNHNPVTDTFTLSGS